MRSSRVLKKDPAVKDVATAEVVFYPTLDTRIRVVYRTDVGNKRENNEDSYGVHIDEHGAVFVVADGMGGHSAGEVASDVAVDTVSAVPTRNLRDNKDALVAAVSDANGAVHQYGIDHTEARGLGTTLVGMYIGPKMTGQGESSLAGMHFHIGDSRLYALVNDQLEQLTDDHTLVNAKIKAGRLTPAEAAVHPERNVLTKSLGYEPTSPLDEDDDIADLGLDGTVLFLLCSDGLLPSKMDNGKIGNIMRSHPTLTPMLDALFEEAYNFGTKDNVTGVLVLKEDLALSEVYARNIPQNSAARVSQRIIITPYLRDRLRQDDTLEAHTLLGMGAEESDSLRSARVCYAEALRRFSGDSIRDNATASYAADRLLHVATQIARDDLERAVTDIFRDVSTPTLSLPIDLFNYYLHTAHDAREALISYRVGATIEEVGLRRLIGDDKKEGEMAVYSNAIGNDIRYGLTHNVDAQRCYQLVDQWVDAFDLETVASFGRDAITSGRRDVGSYMIGLQTAVLEETLDHDYILDIVEELEAQGQQQYVVALAEHLLATDNAAAAQTCLSPLVCSVYHGAYEAYAQAQQALGQEPTYAPLAEAVEALEAERA